MPKTEIDYSNTIIYKITCKDETISDVYVGHTTNFVQRKYAHKICSTNSTTNISKCMLYQVIRNNGGWDNWKMEIIDVINCKDIYDAKKKEQDYVVLLKATLNSVEPLPRPRRTSYRFYCEKCNFKCSKQSIYNKHVDTIKHKQDKSVCSTMNYETNTETYSETYSETDPETNSETDPETDTDILDEIHQTENVIIRKKSSSTEYQSTKKLKRLTAENREMKMNMNMILQMMASNMASNTTFQTHIMELIKTKDSQNITTPCSSVSGGVALIGDNPTFNNNTNNINNTFSMNMFLNEKCKDAMNMKDFVNSIHLNMTDLENVGRLGYVEGMSNIFIDNLQKTDIYKRPVHCSDVKRETLYVKDNNEWQRDGPEHEKMTNAILAVEHKNVILVNEWAKANPRCMNSNTRENEKYFKLSKIVTDGEKDGNIDKVIRKVAKKVTIEKDPTPQIE